MNKANELLKDRRLSNIKSKYVILLSDGEPNRYLNGTTFKNSGGPQCKVASEEINGIANEIRNDRQATLYVLGYALNNRFWYNEQVEPTCSRTGWHHHDASEGFGEGTTGPGRN